MGMASNAIYIHELYNFYDVQTIIRVGSCGGIHKDLNVGDIVVATTAHTDSAMTKDFIEGTFCPSATEHMLRSYMTLYSSIAMAGPIMSSDWFYNPNEYWWRDQQKLGTLAVEMETHILYALANKFNKEALSICTVSDHFDKPLKNMTSSQREKGFDRMMVSIFNSLLC
jgi:purine-nucleoside phosphorylase